MTFSFIDLSTSKFSINGRTMFKTFIPFFIDDTHVKIFNIYDSRCPLIDSTDVADIEVGGIVFATATDLINAIHGVLFSRAVAGDIDNAQIELNRLAIIDLQNGKSDVGHVHDDRYYTKSQIDQLVTSIVDSSDLIASGQIDGDDLTFFNPAGLQLFSLDAKRFTSQGTIVSFANGFLTLKNERGEVLSQTSISAEESYYDKFIFLSGLEDDLGDLIPTEKFSIVETTSGLFFFVSKIGNKEIFEGKRILVNLNKFRFDFEQPTIINGLFKAWELAGFQGAFVANEFHTFDFWEVESTHLTDSNAHADIVATLRDEMSRAGLSGQLLEIALPPEEVVDPASWSLIEKLNAWMSDPLVIQEDTLIYVRYWHSELSDGDAATIRTWGLFMLEPGTYGPGGQPIPQVKVINDLSFGPELEIGTRRVKLSTIPALTQASGNSIENQDQLNRELEKVLIFDKNPEFKFFGMKLLQNQQFTFPTTYDFSQFAGGEEFKGFGNIIILQDNAANWSNLVEWNSNFNGANPKYILLVSYSFLNGGHKINFTLQETISNVSFKQWTFSPLDVIFTNHIQFDFWLKVNSLESQNFQAAITMNGLTWSLDTSSGEKFAPSHKLLEYGLQQGSWAQANFPAMHRVNFSSNFPGSVEIYSLGFGLALQGAGYQNINTLWDEEEIMFDYGSNKTVNLGNLYTTLKGFTSFTSGVLTKINKALTGRFYHVEEGYALPVRLNSSAFNRSFDNVSKYIENFTGSMVIPISVAIHIVDNVVIIDVEDSFEYDGVNGTNEVKLMNLSPPYNFGLNGTSDIIFPGHSWDNGFTCSIRVRPDGVYARLNAADYQNFIGGEQLAFRVEWKLK